MHHIISHILFLKHNALWDIVRFLHKGNLRWLIQKAISFMEGEKKNYHASYCQPYPVYAVCIGCCMISYKWCYSLSRWFLWLFTVIGSELYLFCCWKSAYTKCANKIDVLAGCMQYRSRVEDTNCSINTSPRGVLTWKGGMGISGGQNLLYMPLLLFFGSTVAA